MHQSFSHTCIKETVKLRKHESSSYSRENIDNNEFTEQVRFIGKTYKIGEENVKLLLNMAECKSFQKRYQTFEFLENEGQAVIGVAALRKRESKYDFMYAVESMPFDLRQRLNQYEKRCLEKYFEVEAIKRLQQKYPVSMIEGP